MSIDVTINSVVKTAYLDISSGVSISLRLGNRGTCSFALFDPDVEPVVGETVGIYDGATRLFGGPINEIITTLRSDPTAGQLLYACTAISWEFRFDRRIIIPPSTVADPQSTYIPLSGTVNTVGTAVTWASGDKFDKNFSGANIIINSVTYAVASVTDTTHLTLSTSAGSHSGYAYSWPNTPGNIARSILTQWANGENWSVGNIEDGTAIAKVSFDHTKLSDALDTLATAANKVWYLGPGIEFYFQDRAIAAAPAALTTTNSFRDGYQVRITAEDLTNWNYRQISFNAFSEPLNVFVGDGSSQEFFLTHPAIIVDNVTIETIGSGVPQAAATFGVRGVDTGKDWYWAPGEYEISRDAPATLTVTDATNASPIVLETSVAHGLVTGAQVVVSSVGGNDGANGTFRISVIDGTHFSLDGSTGTAAYTSGGSVSYNAPLTASDVLTVTYREIGGDYVDYDNAAAIAVRGAIEGGTGIYATVTSDTENTDAASALALSTAVVEDQKNPKNVVTISTYDAGYQIGQLLTVTNAVLAAAAGTYLIQQIDIRDEAGLRFRYAITAVDGNGVDGWREYFRGLASQGGGSGAISVSSGGGGTVIGGGGGGGGGTGGGYRALTISGGAITPVAAAEQTQGTTLTQNITVNAPSGTPAAGDELDIYLTQNGTGGWTVAWNATYKVGAIGDVMTDANTYSLFRFCYLGSAWRLTAMPMIGLPI